MANNAEECINMKHDENYNYLQSPPDIIAPLMLGGAKKYDVIERSGIKWQKPFGLDRSMIYISVFKQYHRSMLYQDECFDFSWFKTQSLFLESLTDREIFILKSYTRNGDEVVNALLKMRDRDELIKKLMETVQYLKTPQKDGSPRVNIFHPVKLDQINPKNVIEVSTKYSNELFEIFKKAPPVTNPLRVFRGIISPYAEDPTIYPLEGITSTTYNPNTSVLKRFIRSYEHYDNNSYFTFAKFGPKGSIIRKNLYDCCIYDIILRPGVKAIWLEPISNYQDEQEIAILPNIVQASYSHPTLKYHIDKTYEKKSIVQVYDVTINPIIGKTFTMKGGKTKRSKHRHRKTYRK